MTQKTFMKALGLAAAVAILTPVAAAAQNRFHGLDRNRDGVVSRAEWRGNDQSFRNQDRNHDGVLSGVELRGVPSVRVDDNRKNDKKVVAVKPHKPVKSKTAKPVKKGHSKGHGNGRGGGQG
jgi:hypothetical protein